MDPVCVGGGTGGEGRVKYQVEGYNDLKRVLVFMHTHSVVVLLPLGAEERETGGPTTFFFSISADKKADKKR